MLSENFIQQCMIELREKQSIFHSEDHFKFQLTWMIQERCKDCEIILEYPVNLSGGHAYIDIVVKIENFYLPLELKYKKANFCYKYTHDDELIKLKYQSAQDNGRYFFLRDIQRIEQLLDSRDKFGPLGYAVLLTNDKAYWNEPRAGWELRNDGDFRIHEGCEPISGKRCWKMKHEIIQSTEGSMGPLEFRGVYPVQWEDYATFNGNPIQNGVFRYTVVKIKK